jgi:Kelch motif/Galactose oxidase, central domain
LNLDEDLLMTTNPMKTLHSSLLFFSAALLLNHPCTGAPGQWEVTGSMVQGRASQTATLMSNGDVLVIGGLYGVSLSSAERYNPIKGTWSKIASLPKAVSGHTATLLPNGKVLVVGGFSGSNARVTELFDPPSGTWSQTGNLHSPHAGHTATLLPNGKVLVAGGYNVKIEDETANAELYDWVTGTWSTTGSMKEPLPITPRHCYLTERYSWQAAITATKSHMRNSTIQ